MRRDNQLLSVILKCSFLLVLFSLFALVLSVSAYSRFDHPLWAVLAGYLVWSGILALNNWYGTKLAQLDAREYYWQERKWQQQRSGKRSLLDQANAEEFQPDRIVVRERFPGFQKTGQWLLWIPALAVWGWSLYYGLNKEAVISTWSENPIRLLAIFLLLLGVGQWLTTRYCASLELREERNRFLPVQLQSQLSALVLIVTSVLLFVFLFSGFDLIPHWVKLLSWFLLILIVDAVAVSLKPLFQPPSDRNTRPLHGGSFLLNLLFQRTRATQRIAQGLEKVLGVSLNDLWFWRSLRTYIPPFIICIFLLFWISSAFTVVPLGYQGVKVRNGIHQEQPLMPGLHTSLPWPWGKVVLVPTQRIQRVVLGHERDLGEAILWTEKHYEGEINLLVGDGEELLTMSLPVFYRIANPYQYLTNIRNGEETITQLAYHYLLTYTVSKDAYAVMSSDRKDISEKLHQSLQQSLDSRNAGIQILHVGLKDIHPPLDVADAYQEVISAEEELRTEVERGYAYEAELRPTTLLETNRVQLAAQATMTSRVEAARGQTASFALLLPEYQANSLLFRHLYYFNALERALERPEKFIFPSSTDSNPNRYLLDFRNDVSNRVP